MGIIYTPFNFNNGGDDGGDTTPPEPLPPDRSGWDIDRMFASDSIGLELPKMGRYDITINLHRKGFGDVIGDGPGEANIIGELVNNGLNDVLIITNSTSRGLYLNLPIDSYGMNEQKVELERRRCANGGARTQIFSANTHGWNEHYNTMEFMIVPLNPERYEAHLGSGRISFQYPELNDFQYNAGGFYGRIVTFPFNPTESFNPRLPYYKYSLWQIKYVDGIGTGRYINADL